MQGKAKWTIGLAVLVALVGTVSLASARSGATPSPAFGKLSAPFAAFTTVTGTLNPGDVGIVAIRVTKEANCSLLLAGPSKLHAGPYRAALQQQYASWRWQVPADVRGGTWQGTVTCKSGKATKTLKTHLLTSPTDANSNALVSRGTMSVSVGGLPPAPDGAAASNGKGGGGYPDDGAVCEWTGRQSGACSDYDWGYRQANGTWSLLSSRRFYYRNCTDFVAWYLGVNWGDFHFPGGDGNARSWAAAAGNVGLQVTHSPSVGDVAWWGSEVGGGYGHVAIVTAVAGDGSVTIAEYNGDGHGNYDLRPNMRADAYLHKPSAPPPSNPAPSNPAPTPTTPTPTTPTPTTPAPTTPTPTTPTPTSPIPDTSAPSAPGAITASNTMTSVSAGWGASTDNVGVTGYDVYLNGNKVGTAGGASYTFGGLSCGNGYVVGVVAFDAAGNRSATTQAGVSTAGCPAAQTWGETAGGNAHTWTNYTNAGGSEGPLIPGGTTVQIACKLGGFTVADGNTWWYRIAQSPWNGAYYVSADAFYNNGATSGSLHGTPFFDGAVANC